MKEFEKVVSSPFFNRGRNHMPLLKQLKKFHPKFDDEKMTPEYIYSKMHTGKKFNKQIIWNATSSLLMMAEEFLIYRSVEKNEYKRNLHLSSELFERKLANLYSKKLDEIEKVLDKTGIDGNFFQYKTELETGRLYLCFLEDEQHRIPRHIVKRGEFAILDFLRQLSAIINDMDSNIVMFNAVFTTNLPYEFINNLKLDKIMEYARANKFRYTFAMEMYYYSIMVIIDPDETLHFLRLKELYEDNSHKFSAEERRGWLVTLANYCVQKSDQGKDPFRSILFEINKLQLKEIETSPKTELGKILYTQILVKALSLNETEWVKKYIEKYTPFLKTSYQKTMRAFANAFLAFKLKKYDEVLENLSRVKFIDVRDKYHAKSLSLRSHYELGDIPTLHYNVESAKQFVSKNTSLGKVTRKRFSHFLDSLKKLLVIMERPDLKNIDKLRKEVESDHEMVNGLWLLEKIAELKTKKGAF